MPDFEFLEELEAYNDVLAEASTDFIEELRGRSNDIQQDMLIGLRAHQQAIAFKERAAARIVQVGIPLELTTGQLAETLERGPDIETLAETAAYARDLAINLVDILIAGMEGVRRIFEPLEAEVKRQAPIDTGALRASVEARQRVHFNWSDLRPVGDEVIDPRLIALAQVSDSIDILIRAPHARPVLARDPFIQRAMERIAPRVAAEVAAAVDRATP